MVAITGWNPMREMFDMTHRMNRVLGDTKSCGVRITDEEREFAGVWSPAVDVRENESSLVLSVEL
ncbi:MAG: hypothetical protein GY906_08950, partial [bacterium]|nr:hypothetical protein [bacterium]